MAKVETERFFGKKGIIIMIRDGSKLVSAIFKDKKNADKFNRNNPSDVKKLLQLAKKTKYPKGIDEDTDVGHQDDEPNMLKSTTLEIMEYGKKLTDMLDKYDDMDGEVDFPNWWQKKLILARDYVSAAYHYLDSEEKTSENMDRNFRSYDDEEEVEEGFASNAQRKAAFASGYKAKGKKGKKKNESVNEGKKRYYQKDGIGKSKYTISYHDGKKKHKDGSDFFDIQIFRNKKDLAKFVNSLHKGGYVYGFGESVNEGKYYITRNQGRGRGKSLVGGYDLKKKKNLPPKEFRTFKDAEKEVKRLQNTQKGIAGGGSAYFVTDKKMNPLKESINEASREAMGIAGFTGTRGSAVQKFIDDYNLNSRKLFNFVKKGKLKDRMDFVTAIAGKRGNKFQGKIVGMFGEGKDDGVPQGYNPMVESKTKESKVVQMIYKYEKKEKKFYDKMAEHERRIGPREYGKFIINALRGFGINPREFKRVPDAEEKLYQTVSKK